MTIRRFLVITGQVQGVGYRDALCEQAERRSVAGWVRNRVDGSVEALVQGAEANVEAVITWARRGPPAARVAEVKVGPPPEQWNRPYARFERWPSA